MRAEDRPLRTNGGSAGEGRRVPDAWQASCAYDATNHVALANLSKPWSGLFV